MYSYSCRSGSWHETTTEVVVTNSVMHMQVAYITFRSINPFIRRPNGIFPVPELSSQTPMDPPPSLRTGTTRQPQSNYTTSDRGWRRNEPRERQLDDRQYYYSNGRGVRPNRSQNRDGGDRSRGGDGARPRDRDRSRQNGVRAGARRLDGRWSILRG